MKVEANVLPFVKTSAFAETKVTFLASGELWRRRRSSLRSGDPMFEAMTKPRTPARRPA